MVPAKQAIPPSLAVPCACARAPTHPLLRYSPPPLALEVPLPLWQVLAPAQPYYLSSALPISKFPISFRFSGLAPLTNSSSIPPLSPPNTTPAKQGPTPRPVCASLPSSLLLQDSIDLPHLVESSLTLSPTTSLGCCCGHSPPGEQLTPLSCDFWIVMATVAYACRV